MRFALFLAAASLVAPALVAQSAAFTVFGTGCSTPAETRQAMISNTGLPQLGAQFSVEYVGDTIASTATVFPVLFVSLGPANIPAGPSVIPLPQQPQGCSIYVDPTALVATIPSMFDFNTGTYQTSFPFAVPNVQALIGANVYFQFVMPYTQCGIVPPCTLEAIGATPGAAATIGT